MKYIGSILIIFILFELIFLGTFKQKMIPVDVLPNEKFPTRSTAKSVVSPLAFRYLTNLNRGALKNILLTNTYSGRITKIFNNPSSYFTLKYEKALTIEDEDGKSAVLIGKDAIRSAVVKDSIGIEIIFNDLIVGDRVSITEQIDLSKPNPLMGQKILIIKE